MATVIDVPLNTAIADLDEALRLLLKNELTKHGFEGVEIAFDAPSKEWSGKLTNPTVDLFLYDLREAGDRASLTPSEQRGNGQATVTSPPLRLELSYAVTAWTKAVEDEHRLLSQVLAILFSHRRLPADLLGELRDGADRLRDAETSVGRPREEKADFWTSVGGQYKASIDYVVHIAIESGVSTARGPEVRMQTLRAKLTDRPARTMTELHRLGGTLRDTDGQPVADAWVILPESGLWTATDGDGRFRVGRLEPGVHSVVARTLQGGEVRATVSVPGEHVDLVVGTGGKAPSARKR
jgi:Pvc16 N-terminal domain/Carboxypeptidase regulatory-like domain